MKAHFRVLLFLTILIFLACFSAATFAQSGDNGQSPVTKAWVMKPTRIGHTLPLYQIKDKYASKGIHEAEEVKRPEWLKDGPLPGNFTDKAIQQTPATALTLNFGLSIDGIGQGLTGPNGAYSVDSVPPDTDMAVGTTQVVSLDNSAFAVLNKTTGAVIAGPYNTNVLWSSLGSGNGCYANDDGDGVVKFDQLAQRWIINQFSVSTTPYYQCLAISNSADATGSWTVLEFSPPPNGDFPDYPKLGVWPNAYLLTFDMFNAAGTRYIGATLCGIDRIALLAGNTPKIVCAALTSSDFALLPVDLDGANYPPVGNTKALFIENSDASNTSTSLYMYRAAFNFTAGTVAVDPKITMTVSQYSNRTCSSTSQCVPQPTHTGTVQNGTFSSESKLDTLAAHEMFRAAYRNFGSYESITVSGPVLPSSSGGTGSNTAERWYEIRTPFATPNIYQQSTYSPDTSLYRWMGSIAQDHQGNIAMGYSGSSSTVFPSVYVTGRLNSDPLNTMESEVQLYAGLNSQVNLSGYAYGYRWGDYTAMMLDPDDCTFWYTGEYLKAAGLFNWSTRLVQFSFPSCSSPAAITLPVPNAEGGTALTSGTATFYWTAGTGTPSYTLSVGSTQGGSDYCGGPQSYSAGTYSATLSCLPIDGSTFWVRLATIGGAGGYSDYQYTAPNLKTAQTITFTTSAPSSAAYNSSFGVAATASSGLTVAFTASGVCTVIDNGNGTANYTMTSGTGTCSVIAKQAGNATYSAAPTVTESVTATKLANSATFTTAPPASAVYGSNFTVAASGLGSGAITYTSSGACSNSGATYTMTSGTGTCTVTATQAADSYYASGSASAGVGATLASQAITFTTPAPASAEYGSSFTVAATASSGLTVTFTSAGACSNVGATYTMTASSGTCSVLADQAGNSNYAAAPEVSESTNATNANGGVSVGSSLNPSVYGQSVTFTATITSDTGQVKGRRNGTKPMTVTGSVTWSSNTGCGTTSVTSVGSGSGTATCTTSTLAVGTDTVEADYSGDANHNAGSGTVSQVVNASNGNVTVTSGLNPSAYGQSVTFTATDRGRLRAAEGARSRWM